MGSDHVDSDPSAASDRDPVEVPWGCLRVIVGIPCALLAAIWGADAGK